MNVLGIEFPPISHVIEWPEIFPGGINKVVLLMFLSVIIVFAFMYIASRKQELVPHGVQNVAEATVDFVQDGIILQTIGPEGLHWTPFLLTMFTFIFVTNIWEVIPIAQMPANARIAFPAFMAIVVWLIYHFIGIKHQGPFKYIKNATVPPGVPKAILPLVFIIEFVGIMVTRPLSLAVRLFANMLAGHLLLVSFAVITAATWGLSLTLVIWPFSFFLLIALTGFEVLVAFLQAFIFTILTAVYIGSSMHPEH